MFNQSGSEVMARLKGQAKGVKASMPPPPPRITIINLKGSKAQNDWLEAVHRKTYIPKSVIVRLALTQWAEKNGYPPFPTSEDDQ